MKQNKKGLRKLRRYTWVGLLFFTCWLPVLQAQEFRVMRIKNGAILDTSDQIVKRGQVISEEQWVRFTHPETYALLIDSVFRFHILKPVTSRQAPYEGMVKENLAIHEAGNMSRSFPLLGIVNNTTRERSITLSQQMAASAEEAQPISVIGDELPCLLDSGLAVNETDQLLATYFYNNKIYDVPLVHQGNKILIKEKDLYQQGTADEVDPMSLSDLSIIYVPDNNYDNKRVVGRFIPHYISGDELVDELGDIIQRMVALNMDRELVKEQVHYYLTEVYGKPVSESVDQWLDTNYYSP